MYCPSLPSDPALFLWAAHIGRITGTIKVAGFNRHLADIGPNIEQYLNNDYRCGDPVPAGIMLDIFELSLAMGSPASHLDGRHELLNVWESLADLYGVRQHPAAVVAGRSALILALDALLLTDNPPPRAEMFVPVLDAELAALDWALLGRSSTDLALRIEQIEEDWRAHEVDGLNEQDEPDELEGSISGTAEDLLW